MQLTQEVFEQYCEVQETGRVNMMGMMDVQRLAHDMELYELVLFIEDGNYYEILENYSELQAEYRSEK